MGPESVERKSFGCYFGDNDASVLATGRVPRLCKFNEVLNVVGKDGHALLSGIGQLSLGGSPQSPVRSPLSDRGSN